MGASQQDMEAFLETLAGAIDDATAQEDRGIDTSFKTPQFTTINNSTADNQGTISPSDLLYDPLASAPPSTSFTDLTSPSLFDDSPDYLDSFEPSPAWANADNDVAVAGDWFPLFPVGDSNDQVPPTSNDKVMEEATTSATFEATATRRKSSISHSPSSSREPFRHSSISGVSSRKRDRPLPPIVVDDPNDTTAMKRARNTAAARKSRQKKVEKFEELHQRIEELEQQVNHWKNLALSRNGGQV